MAKNLYQNLWVSKEIRTLILGVLTLSMMFLLELIFLFFSDDLKQSIIALLFWEISPPFGGIFTPLLTIFHLIAWGLMFFSSLMVYTVIREYTGGRTGLIEIIGIIAVLTIICGTIYDGWFALFFIGVSVSIIGYIYFLFAE